ncbi:hypothetical protein [Desulfovibrio legallii]|uniref:hypothetical protein n=1 Tax=Desulfovibrio legallii TaxID=571438 RepID=UPI0011C23002|nr:hypothetical protein [Desulfovibrio legallii]
MANSILDQTTLEESFFFCEYAKRRFEMSNYNNGEIERAIDIVGLILESHYKENYNIPFPMKMDFLSEVISFCEAINKKKLSDKFGCGFVETRRFTFKHLAGEIIQSINEIKNIATLLDAGSIFHMKTPFLPFPYNMEDIILDIRSGEELPTDFKLRNIEERKCFVMDCNNYILFLMNRHVSLDETIQELTQQATLFKSNNDCEKSEKPEILKAIHKKSKSEKYRQSLHNVYYKSIGILLYDLCVINKSSFEVAIDSLMRMNTKIKCDPKFNILEPSKDCNRCKKNFSKCRSQWNKQVKFAVDKIKGTESQEEWLTIIKETPQRACKRRPVSFFEYEFGTVPTPPEK